MGITTIVLPDNSIWITYAFNVAMEIVLDQMACVSATIYTLSVYNLAADNLINYAQDQSGQTYFADLRQKWDINGFVPGVIESSADVSTSESLLVPDFMKNFMMSDLQNIKTPYGRQYLAFAQRAGNIWGIS